MVDQTIFDDEIFRFHAQHAVKKSFKAWIASLGEKYPLTHDIRYLLLTVSKCNCDITNLKDLVKLNLFAVQFRYKPTLEIAEAINRSLLIEQVEKAFEHVCTEIKRSKQ